MRQVTAEFAISLGLTLLLEVPAGLLSVMLRGRSRKNSGDDPAEESRRTALAVLVLANVLTNPVVVGLSMLAEPALSAGLYRAFVAALELLAVFTEGLLFRLFRRDMGVGHPFLFAFALNAWSFSAGLLINMLF